MSRVNPELHLFQKHAHCEAQSDHPIALRLDRIDGVSETVQVVAT